MAVSEHCLPSLILQTFVQSLSSFYVQNEFTTNGFGAFLDLGIFIFGQISACSRKVRLSYQLLLKDFLNRSLESARGAKYCIGAMSSGISYCKIVFILTELC